MEKNNIQNGYPQSSVVVEESGTDLSLRSIWRFFIGNWFWFMISIIICLGAGYLYCKVAPKTYSSSALIYVDENSSRSVKSDVTTMTNFRMMRQTSVVDNEAAILRSRSLMQKVVENMHANVLYYRPSKLRSVEVYAPTVPVEVVVDSLMTPFVMDLTLLEDGTISGKIEYTKRGEEREELFTTTLDQPIYGGMGIVHIAKNPYYTAPVVEEDEQEAEPKAKPKKKVNPRYIVKVYSVKGYAGTLLANLSVAPSSKTTSLISVGMKTSVPQKSADIVNELIKVYNEDAKEGERAVARATMQFVDERLAIVGGDLDDVDSTVEKYRKSSQTVNSTTEANLYVQAVAKLEEQAVEVETQISILNDVFNFVQSIQGKAEMIPSLGIGGDGSLATLINNYNSAVLEYRSVGGDNVLSNPQVRSRKEAILEMQSLLPASITNQRNSLEVQLRSLDKQIAENKNKVSNLPTIEKESQSIMRNQQIKVRIYEYLLNKREETSLKLATTASVSRVIDPAEPSAVPISPKTAMIMLLALIMGMVLPVVVIFIAEALRTKIYSTEEVEDMLPADIPIVGAIPAKPNKNSSDIMVTPNSRDSIAEAFRMVRTNIDFMLPVGGKVIMTTSTVPSEGKTTCALNIALSFAITGKKVIIVDMDMRKGSMEKRIGSTHYPQGIVNYLVGKESDLDKLIVKNCVHGVDALFVGTIPPNPAELVMRKELDEVIEKLKGMYDYIIIDTAPIALVTDTMLANRLADVTLYCMRMGHTDKTVFETLRAITIRQSLKNMGVIISEVGVGKLYYGGEKSGTGFGYGYGYGYGYGHKDEDTKKTIITRLLKLLKKDK